MTPKFARARVVPAVTVVALAVSLSGCTGEVSTRAQPPVAAATGMQSSTGTGPESPTQQDKAPPLQGRARVELWHCGVWLQGYPRGMWETKHPPFDATNAPESFTGTGTARVVRKDRLVYRDDGGQRILFVPGDRVPPVVCM